MNRVNALLIASIAALASFAGMIFAAAELAPLAALTAPIAIVCWWLVDIRKFFAAPGWLINLGGLASMAAAGAEFASGRIESRLLSGGHLLVYLTWLFLLQPKRPVQVWWLAALSALQVAVSAVLTNDSWFGGALAVWVFGATWTLALLTLQRSASLVLEDGKMSSSPTTGSRSTDALRLDERHRLISPGFVLGTAAVTVAGVLLSLLLFMLIPRVWMGSMRFFDDSPLAGRSTGFSGRIQLGDIGEILQNDQLALSLEISDAATGERLPQEEAAAWLGDSPTFRGRVLEHYSAGGWEESAQRSNRGVHTRRQPPSYVGVLRLRFRLADLGTRTLFSCGQVVAADANYNDVSVVLQDQTGTFERSGLFEEPWLEYELLVRRDPPHALALPPDPALSLPALRAAHERYLSSLVEPSPGTPRLPALVDDLLSQRPPATSMRDGALALEAHLRDSGAYQYTLANTVSDRSIDPIEDFLFNRRAGHCEHFATALALMLREEGIPARVVTGFKGGEFSAQTGLFEVRQKHAHAWVEAYVDEGWITLDATPAARDASVSEDSRDAAGWLNFQSAWKSLWTSGVTMNRSQQQELIYSPLQAAARNVWERLKDVRGTAAALGRAVVRFIRSPEEWFSWRGGLAAMLIASAVALLVRFIQSVIRTIRGLGRGGPGGRAAGVETPFYTRFLQIVRRQGLERDRAETPAEFSDAVASHFHAPLAHAELAGLPEHLAALYYRVRYGSLPLSDDELGRVEAELKSLDACLKAQPPAARPQ